MKEIDILQENIVTEVQIGCSCCKDQKSGYFIDEYDFSEKLIEIGWRATQSGKVYCPTCAAKKLKPKKQ